MAVFNFKTLLIPESRWPAVVALLEESDGHVRAFYDVTAGGHVNILCYTGQQPRDKPLHWH